MGCASGDFFYRRVEGGLIHFRRGAVAAYLPDELQGGG